MLIIRLYLASTILGVHSTFQWGDIERYSRLIKAEHTSDLRATPEPHLTYFNLASIPNGAAYNNRVVIRCFTL